jgi:hypothetical protein
MLELPISKYDGGQEVHRRLAELGKRAEEVAATVNLQPTEHFVGARRRIRDGLRADGVAGEIEAAVLELLAPVPTA